MAQPYGDKEHYDFILDSGERFWRVQVKSTSCAEADHSGYIVTACHSGPKYKVKPYRADEIDFFAAYIVPLGIWYVVPVNQLASLRFPRLHPSGYRSGGGCFEAFREAWHLMAPGADLPQPRTPRQVRTNLHSKHFINMRAGVGRRFQMQVWPSRQQGRDGHNSTACGKTSESAAGTLKGRGLSRAVHRFQGLTHGLEAVPLQNLRRARAFPQPLQSC